MRGKVVMKPIKRKPKRATLDEMAKVLNDYSADCRVCGTFIGCQGGKRELRAEFEEHYRKHHGFELTVLTYAKKGKQKIRR